MVKQERLVEEFLELVQIDSESGNESEIVGVLRAKLEALGLEVVEDDSKSVTGLGAGNLIATLRGDVSSVDTILFSVHVDTVPPGNGVKPVVNGDIIETDKKTVLGADDKAGVAALLEAIRVLKETDAKHGDIEFVFTVGEEIGLVGAKALDGSVLKSKYGVALDSGGPVGEVIVASPDMAHLSAKVHGVASHAGVAPENGISAIEIAAHAIAKMKLGRLDAETTANVGTIKGGNATNIVCDYVEIEAEARSITPSKLKAQMQSMSQAIEETAKQFGGRAEIELKYDSVGYKLEESDKIVDIAKRALVSVGRTPDLKPTGGGSDANIFTKQHNIPTVNLGVGYQDIHSVNEKMPIPELLKITETVVEIVNIAAKK